MLGFVVMGYHPGIEDDGVYLSAIKSDLNPALYPHDSEFFRVQLQATVFDKCIADFIRFTHIPTGVTELLWQFISITLIIFACRSIARLIFDNEFAQWAAVAMVSAMLTLPVAGTALYLADQHLHPRNLSTALILLAVSRILVQRHRQAIPLLVVAFVLHPIMASFGIAFCLVLTVCLLDPVNVWLRSWRVIPVRGTIVSVIPLAWVFEDPTPIWRKALATRSYYFLYQWTWYEWLGAVGPLLIFWFLWRTAEKRGNTPLARFSLAVFVFGTVQQLIAMAILATPRLVRLTPLQPMRFLHLVYYCLALVGGGLLGQYLLKSSRWRWAVYLLLLNVPMFAAQRDLFNNSPHLELPSVRSSNPWLQAFSWIRSNTPTDAYFALDPRYLAAPGEDYHSFRALAERSQLADIIKDTSVVTQVPDLGPEWEKEVTAQQGWKTFKLADFERLRAQFGVNYALVAYPAPPGLACRWHNATLSVCQIP